MWAWIIGGLVALIAGISYLQHRANRGTYRSLASRQPERRDLNAQKPLGLEAIDTDLIRRTTRRNEALERANVNWTRGRKSTFTDAAETDIEPGPDDHTYAKWFHRSFMKDKDTK